MENLRTLRLITVSSLLLLVASVFAAGQDNETERLRRKNFVLERRVDSLARALRRYEGGALNSLEPVSAATSDRYELYSLLDRWDELSGEPVNENKASSVSDVDTVLFVPYDDVVAKYVDIYTVLRRKNMKDILRRYDGYEEMIRSTFRKYGVPEDFAVLCIVESACNPNAVSRAGAVGLWQLMALTAVDNGLRVSMNLDERRDPKKATAVAARFLSAAYKEFGSWALALMAYNCGVQRMKGVVNKCDGDLSYENIYKFLPRETREYLPALVATMFVNQNREFILSTTHE